MAANEPCSTSTEMTKEDGEKRQYARSFSIRTEKSSSRVTAWRVVAASVRVNFTVELRGHEFLPAICYRAIVKNRRSRKLNDETLTNTNTTDGRGINRPFILVACLHISILRAGSKRFDRKIPCEKIVTSERARDSSTFVIVNPPVLSRMIGFVSFL